MAAAGGIIVPYGRKTQPVADRGGQSLAALRRCGFGTCGRPMTVPTAVGFRDVRAADRRPLRRYGVGTAGRRGRRPLRRYDIGSDYVILSEAKDPYPPGR